MNKITKEGLCRNCENLEIWPRLTGGTRFVCFKTSGNKPTGFKDTYGRDTSKGFPVVVKCNFYSKGEHYSVKQYKSSHE